MKKHWKLTMVVVMAVAVLASGCGSSSSRSTAGTAGTAAPAAQDSGSTGGASGSPVKLGFICDCSGPLASSFAGSEETIQAWADYVNANGGLRGHPVTLYKMDDNDNSTTALTDVKTLVQSDHVVAIVGEESSQDVVWEKYVASQGIPVVGGDSLDEPFLTNADFYPSGTTLLGIFYGQVAEAKQFGTKYAALYCVEDPACAASVPIIKEAAKEAGMQVSYISSFSSSAPNYTAICQAIKNSGAQGYTIGGAAQTVITVVGACNQQGVTAKISQIASTVGSSLPGTPGAAGGVGEFLDFPYFDTSVPATQEFHTALQKYYPKYASGAQETEAYIWSGAQLLKAAVAAAPSGTITAGSIKQGLYSLHNETLGGLAPPLNFTQGQPSSINCYFVIGIGASSFTEPQGLKASCASAADVSQLAAALKG